MLWVPKEGSSRLTRRRRGHAWRMLLLVSALSLAVIGVPLAATAGPPISDSMSGMEMMCESGETFLAVHVYQDESGSFLDVYYEEFGEPPMSVFGGTEEFTYDGVALSAEVEMFAWGDEGGEDGEEEEPVWVGTAVIEAMINPVGEPETFSERFRDGNVWVEQRHTYQATEFAGTAVLVGFFDIDLSTCGGGMFTEEYWSTNPNAYIARNGGRYLDCVLDVPEGFGHVFADSSTWGTYMDVFIAPEEGPGMYGWTEDFVFTNQELSGVLELFEEGEEPIEESGGPVAEAVVEAALTHAGFAETELIFQTGRVKMMSELFDVTGTVTVNGSSYEMVECYAEAWSERVQFMNPNGPKPTGPTPDNDLPDGAGSLDDRGTINAQTKGAAPAPEAACTFEAEGDEHPLPIGKTLWYSFEGTGEPVTIDSAGSNFDTIMGVYDAELNQLECVDDVGDETGWSLQAAATIDTDHGETYLVQIGGYGFWDEPGFEDEEMMGEFGRIRLRTS